MSGSFHSYNTEPSNFNYQVEKYANPYGKIAGVGCDGTKSGVDATLPKYSSPFIVGGSTGYSFTDEPIGPVAGPKAPYSIIEKYDDNKVKYRNDFAPEFPSALEIVTVANHAPPFSVFLFRFAVNVFTTFLAICILL